MSGIVTDRTLEMLQTWKLCFCYNQGSSLLSKWWCVNLATALWYFGMIFLKDIAPYSWNVDAKIVYLPTFLGQLSTVVTLVTVSYRASTAQVLAFRGVSGRVYSLSDTYHCPPRLLSRPSAPSAKWIMLLVTKTYDRGKVQTTCSKLRRGLP